MLYQTLLVNFYLPLVKFMNLCRLFFSAFLKKPAEVALTEDLIMSRLAHDHFGQYLQAGDVIMIEIPGFITLII